MEKTKKKIFEKFFWKKFSKGPPLEKKNFENFFFTFFGQKSIFLGTRMPPDPKKRPKKSAQVGTFLNPLQGGGP